MLMEPECPLSPDFSVLLSPFRHCQAA